LKTLLILLLSVTSLFATSNYEYKKDEYARIPNGLSPSARYYVATHGEGELGYSHWHIYLMDAHTGKVIQTLPVPDSAPLDTAPDAYVGDWNKNSNHFTITYRTDRHVEVKVTYDIVDGKAKLVGSRVIFPDSIVPVPTPIAQ
jgi:hypothetical protein